MTATMTSHVTVPPRGSTIPAAPAGSRPRFRRTARTVPATPPAGSIQCAPLADTGTGPVPASQCPGDAGSANQFPACPVEPGHLPDRTAAARGRVGRCTGLPGATPRAYSGRLTGSHTVTACRLGYRLIKPSPTPPSDQPHTCALGEIKRFINPGLSGDKRQGDIDASSRLRWWPRAGGELGQEGRPVLPDDLRRDTRPLPGRPPYGGQLTRRDHPGNLAPGDAEVSEVVRSLPSGPHLSIRCAGSAHVRPLNGVPARYTTFRSFHLGMPRRADFDARNAQSCQSDLQCAILGS